MPYKVPDMPLNCDIFHAVVTNPMTNPFPTVPSISTIPCNLQFGWHVGSGPLLMYLLLPALTDIRDPACYYDFTYGYLSHDYVEVPQGSGMLWIVLSVRDSYKGFPAEYRIAIITRPTEFGPPGHHPVWPIPIP